MTPGDSPIVLDRPEANEALVGHARAELVLLDSYRSGRVPHAWIIDGPAGIGKATLAFRFARFVLANPDPGSSDVQQASGLVVPAGSGVARQIAARAHPNLIVLERPRDEDGKPTGRDIPVESVRRVGRFLATTAAAGGWRIVVADPADELNRSSANALLKMLEEPPERCLFLLVAHVPGRLLPTIRSRCRRLSLKPLPDESLTGLLAAIGAGDGEADRRLAARIAEGSLGRALEVLADDGRDTARAMVEILDEMPHADTARIQAVAERAGSRGGEGRYRLAASILLDWIAARARSAALQDGAPPQLARWSEVWEKVSRALAETEIYNLDRTQTLLMAFRSVSAAAVLDAARA